MKRKSKWLSVLAAFILLATMIPFGMLANAADGDIGSVDDLVNINSSQSLGKTYKLTANITISGSWTPIGTDKSPFLGTIDGNGFTIKFDSINVTAGTSDNPYFGLFGNVGKDAVITNIKIINSNITLNNLNLRYVGFIAGSNAGTINNCSVTNSKITSSAVRGGNYYVGSIAGYNTNSITQSYSTADIDITFSALAALNIVEGGIAGYNSGTISQTYNTGSISADIKFYLALTGNSYIGGITGVNAKTIDNSYNTGNLSSCSFVQNYSYAGGITGVNKLAGNISRVYDAGLVNSDYTGGIAGLNEYQDSTNAGTISASSFYLSGTAACSYTNGDTNKTQVTGNKLALVDMKDITKFNGLNTPDTLWKIDNTVNSKYNFPTLISITHVEDDVDLINYNGGNGKYYNPYQISSTTQLSNIRNDLNASYVLMNNITFTDWDFSSQSDNQNNKYFDSYNTLSTAGIVTDYSATPAVITDINVQSDVKASSLADLIQQNVLPKYVLVNSKVYVPITDWTGTFTGTIGDYILTPVWKVPVGLSTGSKPSLTLTVHVTTALNTPTVTGSSEFELATGYSNTIDLSSDDNIVTRADLVASGRLPNIVKVRSGSDPYTYTWKHINPSTWAEVTGTFNAASTTPSSYTLTASTDDTATTVSITINVKKAQTTSISTYQDGQFYNGGLKWIPIGDNVSGPKYTSTVTAFKGSFNGSGYSIYNLQVNAVADSNIDVYAGLFATNEGLIMNLNVDDNAPDAATASSSLSKNKGNTREILMNLFGYGLDFNGKTGFSGSSVNVTDSNNSYAGMIAGINKLTGFIAGINNMGEKGYIKTSASQKSYAGGITGYNSGELAGVVNFDSITSNSASVNAVAGGISGQNDFKISGSVNTGNVIAGYGTSMTISNLEAYDNANLSAGGIVGNNGNYANISNSCNIGGVRTQITSASTSDSIYAGGLIGNAAGTLANAISSGCLYWAPTAKYSVEKTNDSQVFSTACADATLSNVKSQINSQTNNVINLNSPGIFSGNTFLSFALPSGYTGQYNGSATTAGTYLSGIESGSTANIYSNKTGSDGNPLAGISINNPGSGTDTSSGGCRAMKIEYKATGANQNEKTEFVVKDTSVTMNTIAITTNPTQTKYFEGQQIDYTGTVVTATYSDSSTLTYPYKSGSFYTLTSSYDYTKSTGSAGGTAYTITASYDTNGSATGGVISDTHSILTVYSVDTITLNTDNVQTKFVVDNPVSTNGFNYDGLVVTAHTSGNTFNSVINSGYTVTKPNNMSTASAQAGVPDKVVTVTYKSKPATYSIECVTPTITLNDSSKTLTVRNTCTLTATVSPDLGGYVTWSSDNGAVATVSQYSGIVTAVSDGTATITAKYGGVTTTVGCTITVPLTEITAKPASGYTIARDATVNGSSISYITGTGTNVSVSDLQNGLNQTTKVIVKKQNGDTISGTEVVGTGMTLSLNDGSDPLTIVVKGDTTGDGDISVTDLLQAKNQQLGIITSLSTASFKAADVNGSGDLTVTDLLQIKKHILKIIVLK